MASHKWWERPARQTEGMSAISIREGGGCLSVYARACERRVGRYSRMMRGEDMVVVSMRNYIGRSTVVCPKKRRDITSEVSVSVLGENEL